MACFSFDGIKNITCGEGGCIVTSDQAVAEAARDGRLLSVEKDTEKRFSGQRSWEFDVERQGWRYHMSNVMAAIGRVQLTRLDGDVLPSAAVVDPLPILEQVLRMMELIAEERDITLTYQAEEGCRILGSKDETRQIIYNLVDNAAKFAPEGSTITVQISKKDGKAYTTVQNLGATIPPDELPLLFDRFHKADYSRSMDREGVGLGLYIVKTILGNLKENITVTSEDGVTNFTFTLTLA